MISLIDQIPHAPPISHALSGRPSIAFSAVRCPYFKMSAAFMFTSARIPLCFSHKRKRRSFLLLLRREYLTNGILFAILPVGQKALRFAGERRFAPCTFTTERQGSRQEGHA